MGRPSPPTEAQERLFGIDRNVPRTAPLETGWVYTPESSRVAAYQYDYTGEQLRVTWTNGKAPWVYEGVNSTIFSSFDAAPSKGKYINSTLNFTNHHRVAINDPAFDGV